MRDRGVCADATPTRTGASARPAAARARRATVRTPEAPGVTQVAGGAIRAYSNSRREMIPQSRAGSRHGCRTVAQSPSVCRGAAAQRYRTNVTTDVPLDKNVLALRSHSPFRSFRYHRPPCDPYAETADATMAIMLAYCSQHLGLHRCVHSCVGSLRHAKPIPSRYACRLSGSSPRAFALRCASHQRAKSEVSPSTLATSVWPCSS